MFLMNEENHNQKSYQLEFKSLHFNSLIPLDVDSLLFKCSQEIHEDRFTFPRAIQHENLTGSFGNQSGYTIDAVFFQLLKKKKKKENKTYPKYRE